MKLNSIRIQQFRRFNQVVEFNDLQDGLNIFTGPNEAGKSTIAQAIRSAFLEKYNTGTLQDLMPWGDSSAAPQVDLDFEHGGKNYKLSKRFMYRRMCSLNIDGKILDGDEAENYLADLMGFSMPSRGASQAKYWGIPGLLWVGQGLGQELSDSVLHANKPLQEVLNGVVDNISSYDGDVVLEAVRQRLSQLVTVSNRNPSKDYKKALDRQQELILELDQLKQSVEQYQNQVDRLGLLRQQYTKNESEKPWEEFKKHEIQAQKTLQRVQQLKQLEDNLKQQEQTSLKSQELLHKQIEGIKEQRLSLANRKQAVTTAQESLQAKQQQTDKLLQTQKTVQDKTNAALQHLEGLVKLNQLLEFNQSLTTLKQQLKHIKQQYADAQQTQNLLLENQKQLNGLYIPAETIKLLKSLQEKHSKLEIQHNALATKLQIKLKADKLVLLDNVELDQDIESLISQSTNIEIPGVASITISPGVQDLEQISLDLNHTNHEINKVLKQLNLDDLQDVWQKQNNYQSAFDKQQQYQAMLKIQAPLGIEQLSLDLQDLQTKLEQKQNDLDLGLQHSKTSIDKLQTGNIELELESAKKLYKDAENELHVINQHVQEHKLDLAKLQTQLDSAKSEYQGIKLISQDTEGNEQEKNILASLNTENASYQNITEQLNNLKAEISEFAPHIIEQDIQRFKTSAENQLNMHNQLNQQIIQITAELRVLGAQGLEEKALETQNQLNFVNKQVQEYKNAVDVLTRLFDLLVEKKQALILKLHQPLIKRMQTYLKVMFQQDISIEDIKLDENLIPYTLLRQNINAPISDLSFGAREQIGIISRLAYADLLLESGKPTLILLDDALLHSDSDRLQQAKRVLFDAATRHQILLFSCQPDNWRDMGVIPRQLI